MKFGDEIRDILNDKTKHGHNPVLLAAYFGHLPVVDHFITKMHCDPMAYSQKGMTVLHLAAQQGHLSIVKFITNRTLCKPSIVSPSKVTPLHLAAGKGHLAVVRYLTQEMQCDPLCRDFKGNTPLHYAARDSNRVHVVGFFIKELGIDCNVGGHHGKTPLHFAAQEGHLHVTTCLIETYKCDILSKDKHLYTALHLATGRGHYETVKYLSGKMNLISNDETTENTAESKTVKYSTSLDLLGKNDTTPLHLAAQGGQSNIVKINSSSSATFVIPYV